MFTINPYLKIALIVLGIGGGVILSVTQGFWYGFPLWLAGIILLVAYFLLGTVGSAAKALQTEDFDKAEKLLNLTVFPRLLYVTNRAYYYMLRGNIAISRKDMETGEKYLKMAESIKLPTDNEKAMIQIQLANIAASKNRWKQAQIHFRNLKNLKITDANIKEQKKMLEKAMQNRGQLKAAARMGKSGGAMMRQGGKRKRPKMR
jgi:tetratricopeptide (TPR) repeat protein